MSETDESQYRIESFDKKWHDRSNFACGVESLDLYLQKHVNQDLKQN